MATPPVPTVDAAKATEGLALLIAQKAQLDELARWLSTLVDQLVKVAPLLPPIIAPIIQARDMVNKMAADGGKLLDKGPWTGP